MRLTLSFLFSLIVLSNPADARHVSTLARTDRTPEVILSSSAEDRLQGHALTSDGYMVAFETRRGNATPQELRDSDPSLPVYDIDVRFIDDAGFPFLVIMGGHGPIDPTWEIPVVDALETSDEMTLRKYSTARAMITAIADLDGRSPRANADDLDAWGPEREVLLNVAGPALDDMAVIRLDEQVRPDADRPPAGPRLKTDAASTSNVYRWEIEIRKKVANFSFGLGDHSATISRSISTKGVTQQMQVTRNHGAWANENTMKLSCSWKSAATRPRTMPSFGDFDKSPYYCRTPYGFTSGKHVCNDDTYIQAQTIRHNMGPASWVTCGDSTLRRNAPGCS